jgi:DNA-directed RNA polymerase specialized sigma24 family protein
MTWVKSAAGVVSWPNGFDDEPDDDELEPVDLETWRREERDTRIRTLYREGFTTAEVAQRLNSTLSTVNRVLRAAGVKPRRAPRHLSAAP